MADADAPPTQVQKLATEAIGSFVLVLIGCGVAVMTDGDLVATGLAFGLTITYMVYALGRISGRPLQPGSHARSGHRRPDLVARDRPVHRRPVRGRPSSARWC